MSQENLGKAPVTGTRNGDSYFITKGKGGYALLQVFHRQQEDGRIHVGRVKVEKTDYCDWRKCTPCEVCMPPKAFSRVETMSFILKVFYKVFINIAIIITISELVTKVANIPFGLNQKIKLSWTNLLDRFLFFCLSFYNWTNIQE